MRKLPVFLFVKKFATTALHLAKLDVRDRFSRSILGPWWISVSGLLMTLILAPIYSNLFGQDFVTYLEYLAIGMIFWTFSAGLVLESPFIFLNSRSLLMRSGVSLGIVLLRFMFKNLIVLFYCLVSIFIILIFLEKFLFVTIIGAVIIPLHIFLFFSPIATILAILGARFRDLNQILPSIILGLFFLTPVAWDKGFIDGDAGFSILELNPLAILLNAFRQNLSGHSPYYGDLDLVRVYIVLWTLGLVAYFIGGKRVRGWIL